MKTTRTKKSSAQVNVSPPAASRHTGVTIYAKLASGLRLRISKGEWKVGDQLPTVSALAQELNVGKVTVRQAYALLAAEGLIQSHRGRGTHVCGVSSSNSEGLRKAINSEEASADELQIKVLSVERDTSLPADFGGDESEFFVKVRKLHFYLGVPFAYMDMWVLQSLYDLFPPNAIKTSKLNWLVRQFAAKRVSALRQRITVEPATAKVAQMLKYEEAAPLAVVRRIFRANDGSVLSAGDVYYKGNQFVLESELPASITKIYPALSQPIRRNRS